MDYISHNSVHSLHPRKRVLVLGLKDQGSLFKGCWFYYKFYFNLCKFHIHKCKFTKGKPLFMVLEKEIQMYVDVMSKSKNSKAIKTINICPPLTFSHNNNNIYIYF